MSRRRSSGPGSGSPEVIDIDAFEETPEPDVDAGKLSTLKGMLGGVSTARCKELLLAADGDVERAINHHFEGQDERSPPISTAAASSTPSRPRSAPPIKSGILSAGKKVIPTPTSNRKRNVSALASSPSPGAETTSGGSSVGSSSSPFKPASSLLGGLSLDSDTTGTPAKRAKLSRAAAPVTFKKTKAKKKQPPSAKKKKGSASKGTGKAKRKGKKLNDSSESDESEYSDSQSSDGSDAASSSDDASDVDDDDDSSDSSSGSGGGPVRRRGGAAGGARRAGAGFMRRRAPLAAQAAQMMLPAANGGGAAGGGGAARRRGGAARGQPRGRAAVAAAKRQAMALITRATVREEVDDDDRARLARVVTWPAGSLPAPIDVQAAGLQFPEKMEERARWRVGTSVDCSLSDGRGWCRAVIRNVVCMPRSFALAYDVSFEGRRPDVLPDALFRFAALDLVHLSSTQERADPRYVATDDDKERMLQRVAERQRKQRAGGRKEEYVLQDFTRHQLVDVQIGSRYFLGQIDSIVFQVVGYGGRDNSVPDYQDVISVRVLDFHEECTRRYLRETLDRLHPIAFSHDISHYPAGALPVTKDKDLDVAQVYASKLPGYVWSSDGKTIDEEEGEEEEKQKPPEPAAAVPVADADAMSVDEDAPIRPAPGASSSQAAAAPQGRGAASVATSSSSAAAAAASAVDAGLSQLIRPMGRFTLNVVTDAEFKEARGVGDVKRDHLLQRSLTLSQNDPLLTKLHYAPMSEQDQLQRLLSMMQFFKGVPFVTTELLIEPIQVGNTFSEDEDDDAGTRLRRVAPATGGVGGFAAAAERAPATRKQRDLELLYRKRIRAELFNKRIRENLYEARTLRMKQVAQRLFDIKQFKKAEQDRAKAEKRDVPDEDAIVVPEAPPVVEKEEPKEKKGKRAATKASSGGAAAASSSSAWTPVVKPPGLGATAGGPGDADWEAERERELEKQEEDNKKRLTEALERHCRTQGVAADGRLRWYRLTFIVNLIRSAAKDPKKTSENACCLNDLMLCVFPDSRELREATRQATAPLPPYLPASLSLDGLLKHSAHYHHRQAELVAEGKGEEDGDENEKKEGWKEGWRDQSDPADVMHMSPEELSRAALLVPSITLKDYQVQTVRWLLRAESPGHNVSQPFWTELSMADGTRFMYSPTLQRFTFSPNPNIHGGWVTEEMGLGKTIECLALINLKAGEDYASAQRERHAALVDAKASAADIAAAAAALRDPVSPDENSRFIPTRDRHGCFVSRATLIICPVSLISQWASELREKSSRPLKILTYHGARSKDPRDLCDYDVVLTAYSILSKESSQILSQSKQAAMRTPWSFEGIAGLCYGSPLGAVHWRRIVLDEGHSVKNAAAECSQLSHKLLAAKRYLMSGTPFGTSLMDLKGQCRFLGMTGFAGHFLFTALQRFIDSQHRYTDLQSKVKPDDIDGTPFRTGQWLVRFRNTFTLLVTKLMVRHEKALVFRGRSTLLVLPEARVDVVRIELTPQQRAAYKLLYKFACQRFQRFKASGEAVRKTIEVLQLLVPLRQACSVDKVDVDAVKEALENLANGVVGEGIVVGDAMKPSAEYPQAKDPAFGTLRSECSICIDVLENALQTACRHLFCSECILALLESRGADATCPNCRARVVPGQLCAPLILPTEEEMRDADMKEAAAAEKVANGKAVAEREIKRDADGDEEMKATEGSSSAAAAAAAAGSAKKRLTGRAAAVSDLDDERSEESEEKKEEEPELEVSGTIEFDSKLKVLIQEIRTMKERDPTAKALIFTTFRASMDKTQEALKAEGISFEMLLGHYTLNQRRKALERFRCDPDTTVFLLSARAAAAGLTLTAANYVFILEPSWNPAMMLQAINRVWRMGQQKQVNVRYLICSQTVEDTILGMAREKMSKSNIAGDGEGSNLQLLPDVKLPPVPPLAAAPAAAAASPPAAAAAAADARRNVNGSGSSDEDEEDEPVAARGRRRRWGRAGQAAREENGEPREAGGHGLTLGHATNDAVPDFRLHELERLFQL